MKKHDKIILAVYTVIGTVLVMVGLTIQVDYYSPMIFAMGVALTAGNVLQLVRYYHNTRPENIEEYQEKKRKRYIDLKDERKVQLRNRAGYITWAITMIACFVTSFAAALVRADAVFVGVFAGIAVAEYIVATVIYKYLCERM